MIAVVVWELQRRRNAIILWSIGSLVMVAAIIMLYPPIRDQAQQLNHVINTLPKSLRELKTGSSGSLNMADPVVFLNSQLFYANLSIMWAIMTITRGSAILGKEEQSRTLELLLARPIGRGRLLLAKALSLILEMVIVAAVTAVAIVALVPATGMSISVTRLIAAVVFTALFALSFGAIAFALQAAGRLTRKGATAAAVVVAMGGYVLTSLGALTDWLKLPARLAPYHYFIPETILRGGVPRGLLVYLAGIAVVCVAAAWIGFGRRDIG